MSTRFTQVSNDLLRDPAVGAHAKLIYVILLSHVAGRAGICWPSQALLSSESALSRSAVKRALAELVALGAVSVTVTKTPTGRRNRYFVHEGGWGQIEPTRGVCESQEEEPVEEEPSISSPPLGATTLPSVEGPLSGPGPVPVGGSAREGFSW